MTLLISGSTNSFAISSSDLRITSEVNGKIIPHDEYFNKHIIFGLENYKACLTYTGLAKWHYKRKEYQMYDVVSDSLIASVKTKLRLIPLIIKLTSDINSIISSTKVEFKFIEFHIVGCHSEIPFPFMICISNYSDSVPWFKSSELEWHRSINGFNLFIKFADTPDFMIGGVKNQIRDSEIKLLSKVFNANADGFNISNLSAKYINLCSQRTELVGNRSLTTIIPFNGFIDMNYWDKTTTGFVAYMPRIIFTNGNSWGPSKFPVELQLLMNGRIPSDNIFFRSIVYKTAKRSHRRRIFKIKKGKKVPGILGLIGIVLFGKVPDGYANLLEF